MVVKGKANAATGWRDNRENREVTGVITLDEGDYRFHAIIGNVNIFTDTEREIKRQRVLLTNIHNTENTVSVDKVEGTIEHRRLK